MGEILLTKRSYKEVVRKIAEFKSRSFDEDRKENPHLAPAAYGSSLEMIVESVCRQHREHCPKGLPLRVLNYLADKGVLVRYIGDFTFPSNERLPTQVELSRQALSSVRALFEGKQESEAGRE